MPDEAEAPPAHVLAGFGVPADGTSMARPVRLVGGEGTSWLAAGMVFKPAGDTAFAAYLAGLTHRIVERGFRVPRAVRSRDGRWVVAGWTATQVVPGKESPSRVDEIIRVGQAYHIALADERRPPLLAGRDDPWAYADRVAWGEEPVVGDDRVYRLQSELAVVRRPVSMRCQLVHGDLCANVLFAAGEPPSVLDLSPYWRPVAWALAVVVVDGITWYGADLSVLDRWSHLPEWNQMLVRAAMFRLGAYEGQLRRGVDLTADLYRWEPTVELLCRRAHR
ncbi:MAG: TIGR02569 family protein [Mycobacteriales bacterium]